MCPKKRNESKAAQPGGGHARLGHEGAMPDERNAKAVVLQMKASGVGIGVVVLVLALSSCTGQQDYVSACNAMCPAAGVEFDVRALVPPGSSVSVTTCVAGSCKQWWATASGPEPFMAVGGFPARLTATVRVVSDGRTAAASSRVVQVTQGGPPCRCPGDPTVVVGPDASVHVR
jgi:hypothetical protein